MNRIRKPLILLGLLVMLAAFALPAFAQEEHTITLTEEQTNDTYWVTNPSWRAVSDRAVDFQPGQVVVTETITPRRGEAVSVVATFMPSVSNGRIVWTTTAVTADGDAISEALLSQINANMASSWRRFWREHGKTGHIQSLDITDSEAVVTLGNS